MRLARRGFILGGAALVSGCATAAARPATPLAGVQVPPTPSIRLQRAPQTITAELNSTRPLDPRGSVRKELMERALAALDIHEGKITKRDRMYLVDFKKFSGDERLYEVDLLGGAVTLMRTTHGRGSDPAFLAREGKLGRSYGCFSVAHHDLPALRERMGEGRLLFAWA